jgi:hypothetical protein
MQNAEQTAGEGLTWVAYKSLLVARYVGSGMAPDKAAYFADGEINAILAGNHRTHGKPTPADPQQVIFQALSAMSTS